MDLQVFKSFSEEFQKVGAPLTPESRSKLPGKDFAVKAKKSNTGQEAYPIPDRRHASSALGFAKMHGDSADLAAVRAKIKAKYPDMMKAAMVFLKESALKDLNWSGAGKAFKAEVGPAIGAVGGATLAGAMGKNPLSGAALGYGAGSLPEMIFGGHKK